MLCFASLENVAFNKQVTGTGSSNRIGRIVDMKFSSFFQTSVEARPWVRVDLGELFFIHEVVLWARTDCCTSTRQNFEVRAGRQSFSNHLEQKKKLLDYVKELLKL